MDTVKCTTCEPLSNAGAHATRDGCGDAALPCRGRIDPCHSSLCNLLLDPLLLGYLRPSATTLSQSCPFGSCSARADGQRPQARPRLARAGCPHSSLFSVPRHLALSPSAQSAISDVTSEHERPGGWAAPRPRPTILRVNGFVTTTHSPFLATSELHDVRHPGLVAPCHRELAPQEIQDRMAGFPTDQRRVR